MGCCSSKKNKDKSSRPYDSIPLVVQKDVSRFPEETNSTQEDETKLIKPSKSVTSKTTATEPAHRSLRPATSGNKKSEKSKVATAPKNKKKKPKEAVKPEESSSREFAKDSAKFPEKTQSTQTHSDTEKKNRRSVTARMSTEQGSKDTTHSADDKSTSDEKFGKTEPMTNVATIVTDKTVSGSLKEKLKSTNLRSEFPELTEKTQPGIHEEET